MDVLAVPRKLFYFVLRLVGLCLLTVHGVLLGIWERTLRPLLSPALSRAKSVQSSEDVSLPGLLEQVVKVVLMGVLLWWQVVTAILDVVSRPFEPLLRPLRELLQGATQPKEVDH